ncbi:hypothetical protein BJX76DRAFT_221317 [Aspergillus varians]
MLQNRSRVEGPGSELNYPQELEHESWVLTGVGRGQLARRALAGGPTQHHTTRVGWSPVGVRYGSRLIRRGLAGSTRNIVDGEAPRLDHLSVCDCCILAHLVSRSLPMTGYIVIMDASNSYSFRKIQDDFFCSHFLLNREENFLIYYVTRSKPTTS